MANSPTTTGVLLLLAAASSSVANSDELPNAPAVDCLTESQSEPRRQRPGRSRSASSDCIAPGIVPAARGAMPPFELVPDRWRIVTSLGYTERWWDPYHGNNVLKADRPFAGEDWFFGLNLISDTIADIRSLPTPVAASSSDDQGALDVLGRPEQRFLSETLIFETILYKGDTVFRPPDIELRFIPALSFSRRSIKEVGILNVDPTLGETISDHFFAVQGLFVDKHIRNVAEQFDFDSVRFGIQPITADFRGFLFQDSPVGVRLFGTRDNNRWQYNLGWFRRIEKDTNSGLNDITSQSLSDALRDDDVWLFNLYRQDFPWPGFTSQAVLAHNRNRETGRQYVDDNGFLVRPGAIGVQELRQYDVTYIGLNGDGHIGRWNLTSSLYYAFGDETPAALNNRSSSIRAVFAAAELSRDFDWIRVRASLLYGSGDNDPYDDKSTGYDAIFENPLIAGADTSFWIRQAVPLIGGGRVTLSGQNGVLNSLRASKGESQSNFSNPGIVLIGIGADFDLTPKLRSSININQLWFDDTAILEALRNQAPIGRAIGQDVSMSAIYRPFTSQNVIFRLSASALIPGDAYEDLFGSKTPYSVLANLILSY